MFNFDKTPDRRGTESVKWDEFPGTLPMWVADMDFKTAPCILEALQRRLDHGVFGYELLPDAYFESISNWFSLRHGWKGIERKNLVPTTGVIAAYSAAIKAMTKPGDKVIVMTPCYNAFFPAIRNNKCETLPCPLHYEDGLYSIDFQDFEEKAADPRAKALLLCNPHNPVGRVWTREELTKIGEICLAHDVFVISDEIHCELTYPGHDYTPFATLPAELASNSVSCISPTKAFNIAGIQIANIFAHEKDIVRKMDRAINDNECCDVNVFGATALQAAYNEGGPWLDELRKYLWDNAETVYDFLRKELPGITAPPLEGTYLMWLDCRSAMHPGEAPEGFSERLARHLMDKEKLVLSTGTIYGEAGEGFERLNIACSRERLKEGLRRLRDGVLSY